MREFNPALSFNGVGAGQTATLDLPAGAPISLKELVIKFTTGTANGADQTNTEAEVTEIRLVLDGKVEWTLSAAQLIDINAQYGSALDAGDANTPCYLPLHFAEPYARTVPGEEAYALNMAAYGSAQLEIDIHADATTPGLSADLVYERDSSQQKKPIRKFRRFTHSAAGAGTLTITDYPKTDTYAAIHLFHAQVTNIELKRDNITIRKGSLADIAAYYTRQGHYTATAGVFPVRFNETGRVTDAMAMAYPNGQKVGEVRLDLTMGAADTVTSVIEQVGFAG